MSRALSRSILCAALAGTGLLNSIHVNADELPTVVVTPTRSEQSTVTVAAGIRIISAEQIQNSGATRVSEVLRSWSGIYATDLYGDGTDAAVSMRGSDVLIIIDGRRLNNVDLSSPDLNSVSLKDVERIEIIQGSAGALYGDQAVGGVINIVTRSPSRKKSSVEVATGSYSRRRITGLVHESLQDDTDMQVSFETLKTDNYRDNNGLLSSNLLGRIDHRFETGSGFVELQQVDSRQELPGALTATEVEQDPRQSFVDFSDDYATVLTHVMRVGFDKNLTDQVSFEFEVASRDEDRAIQQSFRGFQITTPSSIDNNQIQLTPKLVAAFPVKHGDLLMTLGVDRIETDYQSEITSIDDEQQIRAGYAQFVIPVYQNLDVTLGARKSRVKNDVLSTYKTGVVRDTARSKEFGLSYRPVDSLRLFARVDRNFRFAKVDEFTYTSPGDELDNQKGRSRELGFEWLDDAFNISAVIYRLDLKDEIAFDDSVPAPVGSFFGPGANVNFDPTTHDGLMLDAAYRFSRQLEINGSLSYVDARFDSGVLEDKQISGVPGRVFVLGMLFNPGEHWKTSLEWNYTGDQYVSGDNTNALPKQPSHSVFNANVQYQQGPWEYALRINNLFNTEYVERENSFGSQFPAPELNLWLSARYNFE